MRPHYHYAAAANWLSDPNGLVFADGEWHLFYQYNPQGEDWGHMSWGHAVSPDLARWQELPVAIPEDTDRMIFSGSAVVDHDGTAGFGKGAMIAIYTAAASHGPKNQSQAIAVSTDHGRSWHKYDGNPVIDRGMADFRDPYVFWHAPSRRWVMVVVLSNEQRALIYGSSDLKNWSELSIISGDDAPGRVWECPLLIELPVEGSRETRWMFKVDVLHDAPGSGAMYRTGTFDGQTFAPDAGAGNPIWQVADWGSDFYAAVAWLGPRDDAGRPVWLGWMGNHAYQGQLPKQGWRGAMSVPRRLSLVPSDKGWTLRQELEGPAVDAVPRAAVGAASCGPAAHLTLPGTGDCALLIADADGRELRIERHGSLLSVCRRDPTVPALDTVCQCRIAPDVAVDLWLDAGSLEIIGADGLAALTLQHRLVGDARSLDWTHTEPKTRSTAGWRESHTSDESTIDL